MKCSYLRHAPDNYVYYVPKRNLASLVIKECIFWSQFLALEAFNNKYHNIFFRYVSEICLSLFLCPHYDLQRQVFIQSIKHLHLKPHLLKLIVLWRL